MDLNTVINATILFFATGSVLYFILNTSQPAIVMEKDKFLVSRAITYAGLFGFIFTIIVTLISVQVDKQYTSKKII